VFYIKITGITIDHYAVFPLKMFQIFLQGSQIKRTLHYAAAAPGGHCLKTNEREIVLKKLLTAF